MMKTIRLAIAAALFTLSMSISSLAAEKITAIQISIDHAGNVTSGAPISNVDASTTSDQYTVDNAQFINGGDVWLGGTTPQIQVDLVAMRAISFPLPSRKRCNHYFSQYEATYSRSKRDSSDSTYLSVYINLPRIRRSLYDSESMCTGMAVPLPGRM